MKRKSVHVTQPVLPVRPSFLIEELQVIALLVAHPDLVGSPEADVAFYLLTDSRLRDLYAGARAGLDLKTLVEGPPRLPMVTSGMYATAKDPRALLAAMNFTLLVNKSRADLDTHA